eukprot:13359483-Alexandrium_andersonii.AAC.1
MYPGVSSRIACPGASSTSSGGSTLGYLRPFDCSGAAAQGAVLPEPGAAASASCAASPGAAPGAVLEGGTAPSQPSSSSAAAASAST